MSFPGVDVIWILAGWRAVFTAGSVYLFVDDVLAASKAVESRDQAERIAEGWRRCVTEVTTLELQAGLR